MKALVGSWDNRPYQLLAEITALRTRVRELEDALERETSENERLRDELAAVAAESAQREVALTRG